MATQITSAGAGAATGARPLWVIGVDPERGFAGGESQVLGLTLELRRAGVRAELLCDPSGMLQERASANRITCHPLRIRNSVDLAAGVRLRRFLARNRCDVLHFHTARAHALAPFARASGAALIVTRRMDYAPNRLFTPWLYNRAVDGVAAISRRVAGVLADAGVEPSRITVIESGVDGARFHPPSLEERAAAREKLGLAPDQLALGTLGALRERKGHRYLIEALATLRDRAPEPAIRCFIAGDGPMRAELEALAARHGLTDAVRFVGWIEDSCALLRALDIFAFPSLMEGLGVALLEAMACALPCVASHAGGPSEALENGVSGLLTPPADAPAMAVGIGRLVESVEMRQKMGSAARARVVQRFTMEAMARRTLELYQRCLQARQRAIREG